MVIVGPTISSEWVTEAWRRGGYFDDQYRRAKEGSLPEQVRAYYRRRRNTRIVLVVLAVEVVLIGVLALMRFL